MHRIGFAVLVVAFILSLGTAAPVPREKQYPMYFPTKVGTKWVYERGSDEWTKTITAVEAKDDGTSVTVVTKREKVICTFKVLVSHKGVFGLYDQATETKSPEPWLRTPIHPSTQWEWEVPGCSEKGFGCVAGGEKVEVPAGKYQTVCVESVVPVFLDFRHGKSLTTTFKLITWYAPGVGVVKSQLEDEGGHAQTIVLKSFALGKK